MVQTQVLSAHQVGGGVMPRKVNASAGCIAQVAQVIFLSHHTPTDLASKFLRPQTETTALPGDYALLVLVNTIGTLAMKQLLTGGCFMHPMALDSVCIVAENVAPGPDVDSGFASRALEASAPNLSASAAHGQVMLVCSFRPSMENECQWVGGIIGKLNQ